MRHDIWKFSLLLIAGGVFGFVLGHPTLVLLLVALGIIVWQIFRLDLLYKWVQNPRKYSMVDSSGQIFLLHRQIARSNKQNSKRKRRLTNYLTQFRGAVSALPDAIVLIDTLGKIEWANSNAKDVLGIRWPEDANVRFGDLIRYPEVENLLKQDTPPLHGVEFSSLLHQGQTINIKCVTYTKTLRMIVARDVSRLIKVNQMHRDFVANVSHELKTPLTVLKGYMEILKDSEGVPETFSKPLAHMDMQSQRMQLIVSDLLYLAKLEDNENIKPHDKVDVTHLINTIIESVQTLIHDKHHKLELDIDYQLTINGAQTELHSAFSNLISNAIHYTPDQGTINIRWRKQAEKAVFSVSDNGLGIATQHLSRLTQRFYRIDTDRSRESGGTGLGLAIVKHVLQRHNGELDIQSSEGKGSTFNCIFPRTQIFQIDSSEPEAKKAET